MIQNLPRHINQRQFLLEVDRSGFTGLYNYTHLPMAFDTGSNKGFAFINLVEPDVAQSFHSVFNGAFTFGNQSLEKALRVVKAEVQGFNANAAKALSKKTRRIRNSNFKPILAGNGANGSSAPALAGNSANGSSAPWA
uniref:Mei2-like C-terminal RNA recognition motif domain-containing protein n=1 Tax=Alexandrium catenella TaxID=2925 RepID=A0A7S1PQV2_ALECA|mmetsp:Transcript_108087/g.287787  ORF Transcript_108087/g.287787 Transcript_108087/m.287787 type:complete len:138 (+) Transcript_108087:3-416(+)